MIVREGDIYWVTLDGPGGAEPGIAHPQVVIQEQVNAVTVCAITTNQKRATLPGNVLLEAGEASLPKPSIVLVSRVSTVEKAQLGEYIGSLSTQRVEQILAGMRFLQRMTERA
jgi:mRNA interferase MazF